MAFGKNNWASAELNTTEMTLCEVCADEAKEAVMDKVAVWHCVICNENMCNQCGSHHQRATKTKSHTITEIEGGRNKPANMTIRLDECRIHPNKSLELYCKDCSQEVCILCLAVNHQTHIRVDVYTMVKEIREKLQHQVDRVREKGSRVDKEVAIVDGEIDALQKNITQVEAKITKRANELVELVKKDERLLKQEAQQLYSKQEKEIERRKREASFQHRQLEAFITKSQEMMSMSNISEVYRIGDELMEEAIKIQGMSLTSIPRTSPIKFETLSAMDDVIRNKWNIIGTIHAKPSEDTNSSDYGSGSSRVQEEASEGADESEPMYLEDIKFKDSNSQSMNWNKNFKSESEDDSFDDDNDDDIYMYVDDEGGFTEITEASTEPPSQQSNNDAPKNYKIKKKSQSIGRTIGIHLGFSSAGSKPGLNPTAKKKLDRMTSEPLCSNALTGVANVKTDKLAGGKWCTGRTLVLSSSTLYCYKKNSKDEPEFTMELQGASIQHGSKGKATVNSTIQVESCEMCVVLEFTDAMEHGTWTIKLVQVTGMKERIARNVFSRNFETNKTEEEHQTPNFNLPADCRVSWPTETTSRVLGDNKRVARSNSERPEVPPKPRHPPPIPPKPPRLPAD